MDTPSGPARKSSKRKYTEQKTDKEKSHKGIWWWECPGSVPGINSGHPRDSRDVWTDLCGNSHSRGRMSAGQTGQMTEQMGHVHGTDGTQTRGCPDKILYVYCFFLSQKRARRCKRAMIGGSRPRRDLLLCCSVTLSGPRCPISVRKISVATPAAPRG